jgi:peroxiredoxin
VLGYLLMTPARISTSPDISVMGIDGNELRLADYRGRPLLITFWSTTCPSCIGEMPHLIKLYREFASQGLEIIGIAMAHDPPSHVLAMRESRQIPYPIALDIHSEAASAFGNVRITPTTFLVAPDGRIVLHRIGTLDMEQLRHDILNMIRQAGYDEADTENCTRQEIQTLCSG